MIPWIMKMWKAFFFDELSFVRWARGMMLTFGSSGMAFADSLAQVIGAPKAVTAIKVLSLFCFFLGGAITAGQKNPPANTGDKTVGGETMGIGS